MTHRERERQEFKTFLVFLFLLLLISCSLAFVVKVNAYGAEEIIAEIHTEEEGKVYDPKTGIYCYVISESPADGIAADHNVGAEALDESVILVDSTSESSEGGAGDGSEVRVYVPDSDDDCPVNEQVPISIELQEYLWTRCKKACPNAYKDYYAFCLGVMQHESTFRDWVTHKNGNGSIDRGIMQINSSNVKKLVNKGYITCGDDLFDPYKCVDCALYFLNNYISRFGVSESAYYAYNTGREREGSNKNSRIVWKYYNNWKEVLYG